MKDPNHRPPPDLLEQATAALQGARPPTDPPAEVLASTLDAVRDRLSRLAASPPYSPPDGERGSKTTPLSSPLPDAERGKPTRNLVSRPLSSEEDDMAFQTLSCPECG